MVNAQAKDRLFLKCERRCQNGSIWKLNNWYHSLRLQVQWRDRVGLRQNSRLKYSLSHMAASRDSTNTITTNKPKLLEEGEGKSAEVMNNAWLQAFKKWYVMQQFPNQLKEKEWRERKLLALRHHDCIKICKTIQSQFFNTVRFTSCSGRKQDKIGIETRKLVSP